MRILVIEDEHKIAQAIKKGLEQERYTVDLSFDGESGFDLAIGEKYDVIIMDRMLPRIEGVVLVKKIRDSGNHTPILLLTAKGQIKDKVEGLNSGADDYLSKPFAFSELLARIRALSRRPEKTTKSVLQVSDLTLDTLSCEVKRQGKTIQLSQKEFGILLYLMLHKGHIVTKDQLIAHVWNYDADVLPNTVEVFMGYLRSKIEKPFSSSPLLHTIRGFGYRIDG
ncbi:MAG: response regulator transcription factor [Candidatus Levybacteria bacterium]|nr:response regulator transcription factor [Candidatus Levybacteria bacterium]